jgi:hypothetical protein
MIIVDSLYKYYVGQWSMSNISILYRTQFDVCFDAFNEWFLAHAEEIGADFTEDVLPNNI